MGAPAIAEYLNNKMKTLRSDAANQSSSVRVEIGRTRSDGRDCALMTQGGTNDVKAVVLFEIRDGCIQRYDLCIPQIVVAERTGLYPV